jgi:hypothetical protein
MTIHVGEMTSEVTAEPEALEEGAAADTQWQALEKLRAAYSRVARDQARTAAEGFDD